MDGSDVLSMPFVSRGGEKLDHALRTFAIDVRGKICADFGSSTGGFVDALLQHGATKVYAVETGYGLLDWKLRNDPRVVVMERQNAMHVVLPEQVDVASMDTSWTTLERVIPNIVKHLTPDGIIIALLKPHYEADRKHLKKGKLDETFLPEILEKVQAGLETQGSVQVGRIIESPLVGEKGKNREFLLELLPKQAK